MAVLNLTIPAISCQHCTHTIEMELADLDGVKSVSAKVDTKEVSVMYDLPATPEKIIQTLKEINYPPSA